MIKATLPLELLCLGAFALPAKLDSKIWAFIAVDSFNGYVFLLDMDTRINKTSILNNVLALVDNEDFKKPIDQSFTPVCPENYSEYKKEIETLISIHNGYVVFDNDLTMKIIQPVIADIYLSFERSL